MDPKAHHASTGAPTPRTDRRRFLLAGVGLTLAGGGGSAAAEVTLAGAHDWGRRVPAMLTFSDVCAV